VPFDAAIKLGEPAAGLCPHIPRWQIRGLGNWLRDGYNTIDQTRLCMLIERDLPPLKAACQGALRTMSAGRSAC